MKKSGNGTIPASHRGWVAGRNFRAKPFMANQKRRMEFNFILLFLRTVNSYIHAAILKFLEATHPLWPTLWKDDFFTASEVRRGMGLTRGGVKRILLNDSSQ